MNQEQMKQWRDKSNKLGADLYYTIKDEDGIVRPLAGLWKSDGYGKEEAEALADKSQSTVVLVRVSEVEV